MSARAIQICGTGSGVGKSVIAAGLCRVFLQDGFNVAPFKAQNMSLNSFVTPDAGEIGRAQAMQAAACRLEPTIDMNPVLLKPVSDRGSQVIVRGRPVGTMSAVRYTGYKKTAGAAAVYSFNRLRKNFDIIVIEGAGSPAEVNLKAHDIVNMNMARAAGAPVILVGDIDRGGVFAWLVGTLELLTASERAMIKGFIINKFRGDKRLLRSGLDFLERRTGIKVLGVIPYFKDIKLPEEDSLALDARAGYPPSTFHLRPSTLINIAVIKLPHISNFTDFDAFALEPDVRLRYAADNDELCDADIIIIPGTKNTIADFVWLKRTGLASTILATFDLRPSTCVIGICGGYQMLGTAIRDVYHLESREREIRGLGILPVTTVLKKEKVLAQVRALDIGSGHEVKGYEIHHGRTYCGGGFQPRPRFRIIRRQGKAVREYDGAVSADGRVWGTYIHGVFDADIFRREFLNGVRHGKGLASLPSGAHFSLDNEFDKLAGVIRKNINMDLLYRILDHGA